MTIQVRIGGLAFGGAFVGEIVSDGEIGGKRAFVRGACPGELVEADVIREDKRFVEAKLAKVLEPSGKRISPPCRYYQNCGGCDLQHLEIGAQREAKREMIETTLKFQAGIVARNGVQIASGNLPDFKYRRRAFFHLSKTGELGFFRAGSRDVVDIEMCPIVSDKINQKLVEIRADRSRLSKDVAGIIVEEHGQETRTINKRRDMRSSDGDDEIVGHFSQVNAEGNSILIKIVNEAVITGKVTELYAGAGNFAIPLAQKGCAVDAVELDGVLVKAGRQLVQELNIPVTFFESSCEKFLKGYPLQETVILDPPRSGAKEVVKHFRTHTTQKIVYVSCSLPTLARDLKTLCELGYRLDAVQFVDMFPQTHHVETVSILVA